MKKVLLVLTLVLGTLVSNSQDKKSYVSMYYGTANTLGTNVGFGNFGIGIGFGLNGGVGKDYSNVMGPNAFWEDIYEIKEAKNVGIKLMYGKWFNQTKISAVMGYGSYSTYYNAYDRNQILDPSGYYFTSQEAKSILIYGVNINSTIIKPKSDYGIGMVLEGGYNNFDKLHIGIGLTF